MNRPAARALLLMLPLLLSCDSLSWRTTPGPAASEVSSTEHSLLPLAREYFPALTQTAQAPLPEEVALQVQPPAVEGGALRLVTRGYTFLVRPQAAVEGPVAQRSAGLASYGAHHLLSAGGRQGEVAGAWVAHQAQDFLLLEGERAHRARYEVSLPEGVVALREAGEALDFLDASGRPVLRFHYPVARDATGRSRHAQVRVLGAVPAATAEGRLAVTSPTLTLEVVVDLQDLEAQALIAYVWSSTASMPTDRAYHFMARLPSGKALVFGGTSRTGNRWTDLSSAVVYDAAARTWSFTGAMSTSRPDAAAVELRDGRVLVTGGLSSSALATAELYDPVSGTWSSAASMSQGRYSHTATLLADGRVLVAGGYGTSALNSAELYDPVSNTWTSTGNLRVARSSHTATLLNDGKVLVVGGYDDRSTLDAAELYDPVQGTWSFVMPSSGRGNHTATLLEDGQVLVAGGNTLNGTYLSTCELYDPTTRTWSTTGPLSSTRASHAAARLPNGRVLVVSGIGPSGEAEEYDPSTGTWRSAGSLTTGPGVGRAALLLETGEVLVTGGNYGLGTLQAAELYAPVELGWTTTGALAAARAQHTLTLLPDGRALAIGGLVGSFSSTPLSSVEAYAPATGRWENLAPLPAPRYGHSATLLADGRILVAGGYGSSGTTATAYLYNPANDTWATTGSLAQARTLHSATLLADGRVLVAGGGGVSSAEVYDPATGTFQPTGSLGSSRFGHAAVLLEDGKVLMAGGYGSAPLATAELYDPATGTFQSTGALSGPRDQPTGTLLPDGRVLVAGGSSGTSNLATAELYDPRTGLFQPTGAMAVSRSGHGAIALETGRVLVVGGASSQGTSATSELYDPTTGTWRSTGRMLQARTTFALVRLRTGQVLVAGGSGGGGQLSSAELGPVNSAPVAQSASVTTAEESPVAVTLSASDGDGEELEYRVVTGPAHGTLSGTAPQLTYTPAANYSGSDSFTFRVSDGKQLSGEATLSLTVTPVNDAPVAQSASVTTAEDTPVAVTLAGTDTEGDELVYTVVTEPSHGTLSGTPPRLTYTPAANYSGSDTLTFQISDGQESSSAVTVSLTVTPVNDTPVARSAQVTTAQGTSVVVTLEATDVEGDALSYAVVANPSHGTLTGTLPQLTYTPAPGFVGEDSFTFTASDGTALSSEATLSLTITARAGGSGGCSAVGGEWPIGGLALVLLGARRSRRRQAG